MSVVRLEPDSEVTARLKAALKDSQAGKLDGMILICEHSSGVITEDIVGGFGDTVANRYYLRGVLSDVLRFFENIDTEIHDYD